MGIRIFFVSRSVCLQKCLLTKVSGRKELTVLAQRIWYLIKQYSIVDIFFFFPSTSLLENVVLL